MRFSIFYVEVIMAKKGMQNDRAIKIWGELISVAKKKGIISYKELGKIVKVHPYAFKSPLDLIQYYCKEYSESFI
jgi:hypothetical protein